MLSGTSSKARRPDPSSPRPGGHGAPVEPGAEASRKETCSEDLQSCKLSPSAGRSPEGLMSLPSWAAWPGGEETRVSPGRLSAPESPRLGRAPATGPLARLGQRREARLPFSRFLDEVTVRVLDPGTLEAFQGLRGRSPEPPSGARGPGLAREPLTGAAAPEKTLALSPPLSSEAAAQVTSGVGPGRVAETGGPHVGSGERGSQAASPWQPASRVSLNPRSHPLPPAPRSQQGRGPLRPLPCPLGAPFPHESPADPLRVSNHLFLNNCNREDFSAKRMNL